MKKRVRPETQKISLDLPPVLYLAAKAEARIQGRAFREVIIDLLGEWLREAPTFRRILSALSRRHEARGRGPLRGRPRGMIKEKVSPTGM